jgi:molybdenum cofactor cytidylyltransferase
LSPAGAPRVAALVLAAGRSTRMGAANKLLLPAEGAPLVVRVADAALASRAAPVVVVTGFEAQRIRQALGPRELAFVHNAGATRGLASSLATGLAALDDATDGALICLADMPWIDAADLDALIDAFTEGPERPICVPCHEGRRGNPVLWPSRHFGALASLEGDVGGRALLERLAGQVRAVPIAHPGVLRDIDAPGDLASEARVAPGEVASDV